MNRFRSDIEIFSSTRVMNVPPHIDNFPYNIESPIAFWYKGNVLVCGGTRINYYNFSDNR